MEEIPLILTLLDKSVRQYSLYGPNHPMTTSSLKDFEKKLNTYLEGGESLKLVVKRGIFEWQEKVVFQVEKKENNYIQEMYIDGLREIEFMPAISAQELKNLTSILARDLQQYESREDDTVTLLWKNDFKNFRYQTVDVYAGDLNAILREVFLEREEEKKESEERNYLRRFIEELLHPPGTAPNQPVLAERRQLTNEFQKEISTPIPNTSFELNLEESERLKEEIEKSTERNVMDELLVVFSEVLEAKAKDPVFSTLIRAFLPTVRGFLEEGKIPNATSWLKTLREIEQYVLVDKGDTVVEIENELRNTFPVSFFTVLGQRFSHHLPSTPEAWKEFFGELEDKAPLLISELLKFLVQETVRSTFVDYLIEKFPDQVDLYIQNAQAGDWMLVRDMVRILSNFPEHRQVLPTLRHVAIHPSPKVRLEVIRAMKNFQGETVVEIIKRGLGDQDEEVRKTTLQWMGKSKNQAFVRPLADLISSEAFSNRDASEKKTAFLSLSRCAGGSALEFFKQVLESDESGMEANETKIGALYGIAELDVPQAMAILEEVGSKVFANRDLKNVAQELRTRKLQNLKKGPGK